MKYTLIVPGTKKKSREVASGLSRQEWCQKRAKRNVIPCALCSDSNISATYIIIVLLVLRVYRVESFTISLLMCVFVCTYRQIQSLARRIWVPVLPYPETHISEYWMGAHTLEHKYKNTWFTVDIFEIGLTTLPSQFIPHTFIITWSQYTF